MLNYRENNWRYEKGLETRSYKLIFNQVSSQGTVQEQKRRTERLSLVNFIHGNTRSELVDICHNFKQNDSHFTFDENKRFHVTLLGFPSISPVNYDKITKKINEFIQLTHTQLSVKFDLIRLGTKYEKKGCLKPVYGTSNGTIIAFGNTVSNKRFTTFGNKLAFFLLRDRNLNNVLGRTFRRMFPTVWCTMGHYTRDFTMTENLKCLFSNYYNLDESIFRVPCFELELGLSHYKDLRDWKPIQNFTLQKVSN